MIDYLRIMIDAQRAKMDERGASAVEYGLLIAGIAALIVVAVFALGPIVKEASPTPCDEITSRQRQHRPHLRLLSRCSTGAVEGEAPVGTSISETSSSRSSAGPAPSSTPCSSRASRRR